MNTSTEPKQQCGCNTACRYLIDMPDNVFCKERCTAEEVGHPPIVWLDIETTGLSSDWDQVLEVCFIVTDAELEPQGIYESVIHHPELVSMNEVVWKMHSDSNLLNEVRSEVASPIWTVQKEVLAFFERNRVTDSSPLAGSTIHFDRSFLKRDFPAVNAALHYRNVDVSSLRELVKRWAPGELYQKGDAHRATPDCYDSIKQLRHYRRVFGL